MKNNTIYVLSEQDLNNIINAVEMIASYKEKISTVNFFEKAQLLKNKDDGEFFIKEATKEIEKYSDLINIIKEMNKKVSNDVNSIKEQNKLIESMIQNLKNKVDETNINTNINS